MLAQNRGIFFAIQTVCVFLFSCGDSGPNKAQPAPVLGKIESTFQRASQQFEIPVRLLKAIAFKESGLSAIPMTAVYGPEKRIVNAPLGQTAFGIPMEQLGLDPAKPESKTLEAQILAYGKWVKQSLLENRLALTANPSSPTDKYDWIKQLSLLHRNGLETRRNIQTLFALELMETLNAGDKWQDPESGEIVFLKREQQPFRIESFPDEIQSNLKIYAHDGDIFYADYFELTYQSGNDRKNLPNHIKVIHCPLSLSACLEMQNPANPDQTLRLRAHYVIPPLLRRATGDNSGLVPFQKALQVAQHQAAVDLIDFDGNIQTVEDAIVIMLVGNSGRYLAGERTKANPKWFTKPQLEMMGKVIRSICPLLNELNPEFAIEQCMTPGKDQGVRFVHQAAENTYQWGDIPDFDYSIFETYIRNPEKLEGEALFSFSKADKIFKAGQPITFDLKFIRGATKIVIEYLGRCPDAKLVWSIKRSNSIRNSNSEKFEFKLFQKGPNLTGQHFFRSLIYKNSELVGWAIDDIYLSDYDKASTLTADPGDCRTRGT